MCFFLRLRVHRAGSYDGTMSKERVKATSISALFSLSFDKLWETETDSARLQAEDSDKMFVLRLSLRVSLRWW